MAVAASAGKTPVPFVASPEMLARDTIIAWYRGEFAAANAIIDALCSHIVQITGDPAEYEAVFAAIHRRRLNWIPVLHMQRYFSIADVASELGRVASARRGGAVQEAAAEAPFLNADGIDCPDLTIKEDIKASSDSSADSSNREIGEDGKSCEGYEEEQTFTEDVQICMDHGECATRPEKIKVSKGFVAKEMVKGHTVNVVKGLKLYEDIFNNWELLKLTDYIDELRLAGRRGELSGATFIFFNKQLKGNKREIVQLGVPLFQTTKEEAASNIEPIPQILLSVINHMIQWRLIPESKKPNSCIVNFFDEDEYSQPYFKPPHLENPIATLFLMETTMAFGRALSADPNGDYRGSLTFQLSKGSLLVMRGNSADMARHVICSSPNKRVSITFLKVRPSAGQLMEQSSSPSSGQSKAITLWQPPPLTKVSTAGAIAYADPHAMVPTWGLSFRAPVFMLSPPRSVFMGQGRRAGREGTGVFLPWNVGPKRYTKHLPPRIQKRQLPSLPPPLEAQLI
ncbi:alkylated DNA repair protein alkB like 5 [Apostasia shenzhenica]|uniref:Alkylated DNA repair protein alkB like 5 n=1 Tax=Apostasia shenzhenica TaxID=1088818 RepID=A0A2I0B3B5_9ASPA|nr:alkylated DNA repair protein alkB like 5 [Apostasia shenzhenica]